jgi:cellulose synthase/poly-beta-1,6-N-acetylglucosamine synthase-like glycosyltransferase
MMVIEISVVIPCYNAAPLLGRQLRALADQQGVEPFEVVVVDDGSTDGSRAVAEEHASSFGTFKIAREPHRGNVATVRNIGVRLASGRLLLFCDADDVVGPRWVANLADALATHDVVAGRLEFQQENPRWAAALAEGRQSTGLQGTPSWLPFAAGGNFAIRREAFEAVGGFDPAMPALEDTDLCFRLQLQGYQLAFEPAAIVHVRLRQSLRAIYRQGRSWGYASVALYTRFREQGMPGPSRLHNLGGWLLSGPRLLLSFHRDKLAQWFFREGWRVGRLRANVDYHTLLF